MFKTIFKIYSIFRKMHLFLGLRKKSVFQEISTFSVLFSLVDHIIHICIKTWLKIRLSNVFSTKCNVLSFSSQNYAFHNTAEKKSMSMQMISDEMHSDTIEIR